MPKINKEVYTQGLKDKYTILQLMEYIKKYFPTIIDTNNEFVDKMIKQVNTEVISETETSQTIQVSIIAEDDTVLGTFNYTVLNGEKGDKGDKGEKGEQGDPGEKGDTGEFLPLYEHAIHVTKADGQSLSFDFTFSFINRVSTRYTSFLDLNSKRISDKIPQYINAGGYISNSGAKDIITRVGLGLWGTDSSTLQASKAGLVYNPQTERYSFDCDVQGINDVDLDLIFSDTITIIQ